MSDTTAPHSYCMRSLRPVVAKHPIGGFLVLVYGITAVLALVPVGTEPGLLPGGANLRGPLAIILGSAVPAFVVTAAVGGRDGGRDGLALAVLCGWLPAAARRPHRRSFGSVSGQLLRGPAAFSSSSQPGDLRCAAAVASETDGSTTMMTTNLRRVLTVVAGLAALALGGGAVAVAGPVERSGAERLRPTGASASERLPRGSERVELDPADFTTTIDNPYFPLRPGDRRVYRKLDIDGSKIRVVETVTNRTKLIANGVTARVVHVVDTERGQMIEETFDWYAQDRAGNVWYVGEDTKFFKNGKQVFRPDSWQAGVDGAQPGVVMPARPRIGQKFRQEYAKGVAQDRAHVLARVQQVEVPGRHFKRVLLFEESTPLEPKVLDLFFFARGVGLVLAVEVSGGAERLELVQFKRAK